MRRWLRFKEAMWDKSYDIRHQLKGPVTLFDFSDMHDAADAEKVDLTGRKKGWRISDDETIGGFSWCQMKLIQSSEDYQEFVKSRKSKGDGTGDVDSSEVDDALDVVNENDEQNSLIIESSTIDRENIEEEIESASEFVPFIRWWGHIDTRVGMNTLVQRSGFCAIRSPEFLWNGAYM
jgi:hypothetical protein